MMRISISGRERRTLLIGVTSIIGLITASRGIPAWRTWTQETVASAAELRVELVRAETSVLGLEVLLDTLEHRKERFLELAPLLVGVESSSAAAGTLTSLVSAAAEAAGVQLGAVHVQADTVGEAAIRRVAVRADGVGDIQGIAAFLAALEGRPPILAVRELSITQPEPAAPDDRPEALQIQLRIEGLAFEPPHAEPARAPEQHPHDRQED